MPQLMHDDEQIKEDDDLEEDENDAQNMPEHECYLGRGQLPCLSPGPLIGPQYCIEIGVRNVAVPVHDLLDRLPDAREGNLAFKES